MPGRLTSTAIFAATDQIMALPMEDEMLAIGEISNSFAQLPAGFFSKQAPTRVARPELVIFNHALAAELRLETAALDASELAAIFAGNVAPAGAEPIAMAYAGHQFGNFVP